MNESKYHFAPYQPLVGCVLLLVAVSILCLMPLFLIEAAQRALEKLHLSPTAAMCVLMGIFVGGLVNIPVLRIEKHAEQPLAVHRIHSLMGWVPVQRTRTQTILAVNVGGCLIPLGLALFELTIVLGVQPQAQFALLIAVVANVAVCYLVARPIQGVGIAMPAFASPAVAVGVVWLLLMPTEYAMVRAPIAFIAGVSGPLIGADLLHLRDITRISTGIASIGGAGTFDGIVLSGLLAAFLV